MPRYWKAVYVETEDEQKVADENLQEMINTGALNDMDVDWEEVNEEDLDVETGEVVSDFLGRTAVVTGPRCSWCIENGVADCSHIGM